ncbi:MAG: 50S ribosomal protein L32 [bacterium]|nr:50S ribosomal protein L32 [bacterium]
MAPLPKRKHSTQRKGKRMIERLKSLPKLVKCDNCGKTKLPHKACKYCKK